MITQPDSLKTAETALTALLNQTTLADGTALNTQVEIGVGLPGEGPNAEIIDADGQKQVEMMRITVKTPLADSQPAALRDALRDALSEVPPLDAKVQFESEEAHALALRTTVTDLIAKGADIPSHYLEWIGFSDKPARPRDHALTISTYDNSISVEFRALPANGSEDVGKIVTDNIKSRLGEIKTVLAERIAKYKGVSKDDAAGMAAIKQRVEALDFEVTESSYGTGEKNAPAHVTINIQTAEQKAFIKDKNNPRDPVKMAELGKSNPLNELTPDQLNKALGRAILFGGDKASEVFPKVAGREDMRRAIVKSLVRLKAAKPELTQEVDGLLADDSFKPHFNYGKPAAERPVMKAKPFINKDPGKPGEMTVEFALPAGQAHEVIKQIAALQPPAQEQAPSVAGKIVAAGPPQNWAEQATAEIKAKREGKGASRGAA